MPVGPFKTFADCVRSQKQKGASDDSAKKICGEIEKRSKKGESSMKEWRKLSFNVPITEFVKDSEASADFIIRGPAINETTTRNGITYVAEELSVAASSFRDKPILKDHTNSVDSIVGRTTENVNFDEMRRAIMFEARIMDTKMREMIVDGRIKNVSIGAMVNDIEEKEMEDGGQQLIARGMEGVEISLVAVPADKDAGFAQAMMESFELKTKEAMSTHTNHNLKIMGEKKMVKDEQSEQTPTFGTQEEYSEFIKMKEVAKERELREQIEKEIREKLAQEKLDDEEKKSAETEDLTKGQTGDNDEEGTTSELFEGYTISMQDKYSTGGFITKHY